MTSAGQDHWETLANTMGAAYLRYSFTKGTAQEVGFLIDALELRPGMRLLDVGCGPGRHSIEFAKRGIEVVGVDIAQRFIEVAVAEAKAAGVAERARFQRCDARELPFEDEFDAAISLCQGGMGLGGEDPIAHDVAVLSGMRRALKPGGRLALSAFSAYFQVRWLEDHDTFDAATAVNHEPTEVRDESGTAHQADLWTTCSTPRELRLLMRMAELDVERILSVEPGKYGWNEPTINSPELLVLARRAV